MIRKAKFLTTILVALATIVVVAGAAAALPILGINQQAEAIAIDQKGVKIDITEAQEDGDPVLDLDIALNALEGDPIPDLDVKLGICVRGDDGKLICTR